ncbi:MAG: 4-hydroxy-tetrahydrodipicolinate synthase [Bacteroidota bacterium]
MKEPLFSGTGVALVTPFSKGRVDYRSLERIIEYTIAGGVDYLVCLGSTGEAVSLSAAECRRILDFTLRITNGRLPVVAGFFGGNYTAALAQKIAQYNFDGVAGILSSSPAYSKPSQEGIYQHYMAIAETSPVPIIIYNVPGRTASNVNASTLIRLANASEKFVAVKEASGDMIQTAQLIKNKQRHFQVLSGDDPTCLPALSMGANGVISVIANALPDAFSDMVRLARQGDFRTARSIHLQLLDLHHWLYVEGNPPGIKSAMQILGMGSNEVRLPLSKMSEANYAMLKKELDQVMNALKAMHPHI